MQLVTFGVANCDDALARLAEVRSHIEEKDLRAALKRMGVPSVDMLVDTRCLSDPEKSSLTWHTGRHPEIIRRLANHPEFPGWLNTFKTSFRTHCVDGGAGGNLSMTIGVYCKSGKHRSVAAALILAYIFAAEGWFLLPTKHLSMHLWGSRGCHICARLSEVGAALQMAVAQWRKAQGGR